MKQAKSNYITECCCLKVAEAFVTLKIECFEKVILLNDHFSLWQ